MKLGASVKKTEQSQEFFFPVDMAMQVASTVL
jgi:hypothetical protein